MAKNNIINKDLNRIHLQDSIYIVSKIQSERYYEDIEEKYWMECAIESLNVAKLCIEKDYIPSTVYNLQQSVEKLSKVILFSSTAIVNIKAPNHRPHEAYYNLFNALEDTGRLDLCEKLRDIVSKSYTFDDRLKRFKTPFNSIINKYNNTLKECHSMEDCMIRNTSYYQDMLVSLAYLFSDTQSNSRYPINNISPKMTYGVDLKEDLLSIIGYIENVIEFMNNDVRL